jgi:hypothetical protein
MNSAEASQSAQRVAAAGQSEGAGGAETLGEGVGSVAPGKHVAASSRRNAASAGIAAIRGLTFAW